MHISSLIAGWSNKEQFVKVVVTKNCIPDFVTYVSLLTFQVEVSIHLFHIIHNAPLLLYSTFGGVWKDLWATGTTLSPHNKTTSPHTYSLLPHTHSPPPQ